jgi:hypothetical protein
MANNTLTTDLNTSPYYDDYDPSKGYHRILFKPSLGLQARELTQMQSIQQNQIDGIAENLFKEGSLVSGGQFIFDKMFRYVQINDFNVDGLEVTVQNLVGSIVTGLTTRVRAKIEYVDDGNQNETDKKTLYVKYLSSGNNGNDSFVSGENLLTNTGYKCTVVSSSDSRGTPYIFKINSGKLYAKDHIIQFPDLHLIVSKYTRNVSKTVGFTINEDIVTYLDDATLLDPAQGTPNYAAPGADRLKLTPVLSAYSEEDIPDDFILLFRIENGILQEKYDKTQYNIIRDYMATRTEDESGSYYVRGMNVSTREHLKTDKNLGLYTAEEGGDNNLLVVGISPGKAYVNGYDVETIVTSYVPTKKGLEYNVVEQQPVTANYGNYIIIKELIGSFPVNESGLVYFYNAFQNAISQRKTSTTLPSGSLVGSARVKCIVPISGVMGTSTAEYALFLQDISITTGNFSGVKSIYIDNASEADCHADLVVSKIYDNTYNESIYPIGTNFIRSLRDENDEIDNTFSFIRNFPISVASNGTFAVSSGNSSEVFSFSPGILSNLQKKEFMLSLNSAATVTQSGTVDINNTNLITGTGTFFTRLNVGDKITIDGYGTYTIQSITNNTTLYLTTTVVGTASGLTYVKQYNIGDIIDFTTKGANLGTDRSIEITSNTTSFFDMKETLSNVVSANLICKMNRTEAKEAKKIIRKNRFVRISAAVSGTTGPFNLGISDVFKINSIRRLKGSNFTAANQGTDVTGFFTLDNGQRKSSYENARIVRKAGFVLAANDFLLISLDYFVPDFTQGVGYFSVDSYPIDDVNGYANTSGMPTELIFKGKIEGKDFDLRNCIDTRPIKSNTATDSTTVTGASTSPALSGEYTFASGGLRTPYQNENFIIDYSYYLPRHDLVVLDKSGKFRVIFGKADISPKTPDTPANAMSLARLSVAPYPSLSSSYATQIKRLDLANSVEMLSQKRYTMQGIGLLEKRIEMLEYYTALSLLEKQAIEMRVTDENGLDRFKNGIFVDPFNDHTLGDQGNPDYSICIDPKEKSIRPKFIKDSIDYRYLSGTNVKNGGGVITLDYDTVEFAKQPFATDVRNTAGFFWNFKGTLILQPDTDTWTETKTIPDIVRSVGPTAQSWNSLVNAYGTVWEDWETTWTGQSVRNISNTVTVANTSTSGVGGTNISTTTTRVIVNDVTTTEKQLREGSQLRANITNQSTDLGDRVIDTSVIPYMRSRIVNFTAYGLKPNTRFYAFFDDENVSNYCALRTLTNNNSVNNGSIGSESTDSVNEWVIGSFGAPLLTDSSGVVRGVFRIPNNENIKFKTGTKKFRLTDSFNNGSGISAAEKEYTASGLVQTKQGTIITTTVPTFSTVDVAERRTISDTERVTQRTVTSTSSFIPNPPIRTSGGGSSNGPDPVAQTFYVDTGGKSEVIFLTALDLYFQSKDPTLGFTLEIREVDSASQITYKVLPYSRKYIPSSRINVSSNGSVATRVTLNSLIILQNKKEYAFVVIPEQNNPNTILWTSKLGNNDLITGRRVTVQPFAGNLYVSSNNRSWSAIQDEDIKFNLYRASFKTNSGSFTIRNTPRGLYRVEDVTGGWTVREEEIHGETRVSFSSLSGVGIAVDDVLIGATSGANATVKRISGTGASGTYYVTYEAGEAKLIIGESISITAKNTSGTINTLNTPRALLYEYEAVDTETLNMTVDFLVGRFSINETLTGQVTNNKAKITSYNTYPYSVIDFEPSYLDFFGTSVNFDTKNILSSQVIPGAETIEVKENKVFKTERSIFSVEVENATIESPSIEHTVRFATSSNYCSPVLDLNRTYSVLIHNIINDSEVGEDSIFGGECINKYVSQKITLDEGMDAEDLLLYLTAYKPPTSNISVYAKFIHAEDGQGFEDKNWIKLTLENPTAVSNIDNTNDFKELKYIIPKSYMTGPEGKYQYISEGITYTGFKKFQFKVLLLGTSSVRIPRCKDLRSLCVQI